MEWGRIPPDSRVRVIPFLSVQDNLLGLNVALTTTKDELRDELKKSYVKAVIPAFHTYPFTDENNFADLRRVTEEMGVDLQSITLRLSAEGSGGKVVTERDEVLWCLVDREVPDIAALYVRKSEARDTCIHSTTWRESLSTLWIAACNGYMAVVQVLIHREADINRA